MTAEEIGRTLQAYQNLVVEAREGAQRTLGWSERDARIAIFNKLSNALLALMLGYVFAERYLSKKAWWHENSAIPITDKSMFDSAREFEMFLRIGLVQNIMYAVESSFRIFVRSLDPAACKGGNAEFQSIYRYLLKRINLESRLSVLDLWRNIRNTIHNNGIFMPPNGSDETIIHKSVTYKFVATKSVEFVNIELLLFLISDIITLIADVVVSPTIKGQLFIEEIS